MSAKQGREHFCSLLESAVRPFIPLSSQQLDQLWQHFELLIKWNRVVSLTTVDTLEDAVHRHYAESLFLAAHLPAGIKSIADMGTGPGFPGFPCAVVHPEVAFSLIESVGKKAAFLRESAALPNVRVHACRAEDLPGEFDWVISRAVRPRDVISWALSRHASIALLIGRADAVGLPDFEIRDLPWGENRVLAIRHVPRGT